MNKNNFIYRWIEQAYLRPNGKVYQCLVLLDQYRKTIHLSLFLIIACYPIILLSQQLIQQQQNQQQLESFNQQIEQNKRSLASLQQYHTQLFSSQNTDSSMVKTNQQIKQIAERYNGKIEQIHWNTDSENSLNLIVNQQSSAIFNIIRQLNRLEHIAFRELTLLKLDRSKLIQLNAQLVTTK
ncbi:hypothetical protein A1D22_04100 [Pasteurellaceae bacterium LFhippo2]|nr:hypothetical protein [Pasteurellaceae bacterium LFhippo2]